MPFSFPVVFPVDIDADNLTFSDESTQSKAALPDLVQGRLGATVATETKDISPEDTTITGIAVRPDGTSAYATGSDADNIIQYDLTVPWDISTAALVFQLDVSAQDTSPLGIALRPDGVCIYMSGAQKDTINQYELSTPWLLSTASLLHTFDLSNELSSPGDIQFQPLGFVFFIPNFGDSTIFRYVCSVAWDVSTAEYSGISFVAAETSNLRGLTFRADGLFFTVSDSTTSAFYQYQMLVAWDITTAFFVESIPSTFNPKGLDQSPYSHRLYNADSSLDIIQQYDIGLDTDGLIIAGGEEVSRIADNTVEVFDAANLDDLATAGVITVTGTLILFIMTDITSATTFVLDGGTLIFRTQANSSLTHTGNTTFISGTGNLATDRVAFVNADTAKLVDIVLSDINFFVAENTQFFGWADLGEVKGGILLHVSSLFGGYGAGLILTDMLNASFDTFQVAGGPGVGSALNYFNTVISNAAFIVDKVRGTFTGTETLLHICPAIKADSKVTILSGTAVGGNGLFDESGATGTFTVVADAAIALTTIDSVSDDGAGSAEFNFTVGPTVFVDQQIVISGFVTNTAYNGTFIVTTVAVGSFVVESIPFGTDEVTGDFLSNSITLTDVATTLDDGDTLVIDTDDSAVYDGGFTVYNRVGADTFQIDGTFDATATGSWSQAGLGKKDARVLASLQQTSEDSKYIGAGFLNDNAEDTTTITNGVFKDITFGTGAGGFIPGSNMERWKLIDPITGVFEYVGGEAFDGFLSYNFTSLSSGGAQQFKYKWLIDSGGGFVDLADNVEALAEVGSEATSVSKTQSLMVTIGDQIKPQVTRVAGTSDVLVSYATVNISG